MGIAERYSAIRRELPPAVAIVLAAKTRTAGEVREAIAAGVSDIGYNYVQEAVTVKEALGEAGAALTWHLIGHLQTNKVNKALGVFNVIQTVDSVQAAQALGKRVESSGKPCLPVLIEVNIAQERNKSGAEPQLRVLKELAAAIGSFSRLRLEGLMTMGPAVDDPEQLRPHFRRARELFEGLRDLDTAGADIRTLSMGMSDSYVVAVEEGSTMVRLGTIVFGPRGGTR
jgi:pyridoxal phosphate enzyme (YggS family)